MIRVHPVPPAALLEWVNTFAAVPRREAGQQPQPPRLEDWSGDHDPIELDAVVAVLTEVRPESVAALADEVYEVFAETDEARRREILDGWLTETRPRQRVRPGIEPLAWEVERASDRPLACVALTFLEHLSRHGDLSRLGCCSAHGCADAFIDGSPGGHRRFCSTTCQTRARVATHRARRRG